MGMSSTIATKSQSRPINMVRVDVDGSSQSRRKCFKTKTDPL